MHHVYRDAEIIESELSAWRFGRYHHANVRPRIRDESLCGTAEIRFQSGCLGIAERLSFRGHRSVHFRERPLANTPCATLRARGRHAGNFSRDAVACPSAGVPRDSGFMVAALYTIAI